ncbi:MAG: SMP-30/gluconolactonase/LRE family protein [Burkholderiales bacterium]|jgi:sugar lactone lactonase YvrE|nr:SMP-30/gluconolactonase/LRE family protein [Burkholderiales bacterium]
MRIELLIDAQAQLGESPLWCVDTQRLWWVDALAQVVHACDARGEAARRWPVPSPPGAVALRAGGGAVLALRDGFHAFDPATGTTTPLASVPAAGPNVRMNDGKVDRQGRFFAGQLDADDQPIGRLFRLDADHRVHTLADGITCSNGPCFSPDGRTFYFTDTFMRAIHAFDLDLATGALSNRRVFADFAALRLRGWPDGATVDADGGVWSVAVHAGRLLRFTPDGALDRQLGLPVAGATSVAFGGAELDVAYVTSMRRPGSGRMPREREAGGVFAIHGLGVRGLPENRWAG